MASSAPAPALAPVPAPASGLMLLLQVEGKRKCVCADEIETRLKEAALRRQRFHAWVASKAKSRRTAPASLRDSLDSTDGTKPLSACTSARSMTQEDANLRLELRLEAALKKRKELAAQQQKQKRRTAQSRQQAAQEARLRLEAKVAELESQREVRDEKAESNRAALLEAERAKRAAVRHRAALLRARRMEQEWRDNQQALLRLKALGERLQAAEQKRKDRLDAERERAAVLSAQARLVAETVWRQREKELQQRQEKLDAKVMQARGRRAELMSRRGGCKGLSHRHGGRKRLQWEHLSKKLSKCWRAFRGANKTTCQLAVAFAECHISKAELKDMPFDDVAARISAPGTLSAAKALLQRLLLRLILVPDDAFASWQQRKPTKNLPATVQDSQGWTSEEQSQPRDSQQCVKGSADLRPGSNIDHLLTRLLPSKKRAPARRAQPEKPSPKTAATAQAASAPKGVPQRTVTPEPRAQASAGSGEAAPERYPVRPFLSAYMVVLHPDAVMTSISGPSAEAVRSAASLFVSAFESVVARLLGDGRGMAEAGRHLPATTDGPGAKDAGGQRASFRDLLLTFDAAWIQFLHRFVAWKEEDERQLEKDLIGAACRLEVSMLRKCSGRAPEDLSHDLKAIQQQVANDHRLLRVRIQRLTGSAGVERLETALHQVRLQLSSEGQTSASDRVAGATSSSSDCSSSAASSAATSPCQSPAPSPRRSTRQSVNPASPQAVRSMPGTLAASQLGACRFQDTTKRSEHHSFRGAGRGGPAKGASPFKFSFDRPKSKSAQPGHGTATGNGAMDGSNSRQSSGTPQANTAGLPADQAALRVVDLKLQQRLHQEAIAKVNGEKVDGDMRTAHPDGPRGVLDVLAGAMKDVFWSALKDDLVRAREDGRAKAEAIIREFHAELKSVAPVARMKEQVDACLVDSLAALKALFLVLSGPEHSKSSAKYEESCVWFLGVLDSATAVLLQLGAPAKDEETLRSLRQLKGELHELTRGGEKTVLAVAVTKGLRFLYDNLEALKQDIAAARINLLPLPSALNVLRSSFTVTHKLATYPPSAADEVATKLPQTWAWLCTAQKKQGRGSLPDGRNGPPTAASDAPLPFILRTGRGPVGPASASLEVQQVSGRDALVVADGVVSIVAQPEGARSDTVPETMEADVAQLRACQEEFQEIVVTSVGMLLAKQALVARGLSLSSSTDFVLERGLPQLRAALKQETVTAASIGKLLSGIAAEAAIASGASGFDPGSLEPLITQLLAASLGPSRAVFQRVASSVQAGVIAFLERHDFTAKEATNFKGSKDPSAVSNVQAHLRRAGAGALLPELLQLSKRVAALCHVTILVHGPLYRDILALIALEGSSG